MKKQQARTIAVVLALAVAGACSSQSPMNDEGGEGGSDEAMGGKGSGGKTGMGGKGMGGSDDMGGAPGMGGKGMGGAPGMGGSEAMGGAPGMGGSEAMGGAPGMGGAAGGATGKFTITVDGIMMMDRLCFKPEASNSGGNKSPKIDWTTPPEGTKSLALTMFDQTNNTPHRIVCNIMPDVTGQVANVGTMVFPGAQVSTGHSKPGNMWYGPGAGGDAHSYEIAIWALSTPMLEGGCATSGATATRAVYNKLKNAPTTLVLAHDAKVLWGNVNGKCFP
jgi:phosphatidylethanolamine-binding protein (PEBP) family uncharacterized protein